MQKINGKTALITGASGGLGAEIARQLAARGYNVALTARSAAPMADLASKITREYGVTATVHPHDLSQSGAAETLVTHLDEQGVAPDILVNNAAFGLSGPFVDHDLAKLTSLFQLNMVSLAELTLLLGRRLFYGKGGRILLVGSGAAFQPTPTMAAYGATKAFLLSLGEALHVELAPKVCVTVVSPGTMETGFNAVSGFEPSPALQRMTLPIEYVAKVGLDAMFAGRPSIIPGRMNNVGVFMNRFLSRNRAAKIFLRMSEGK